MHLEILVEDQSGKIALASIMPKLLPQEDGHTYRLIAYKGVGRLPRNLRGKSEPRRRILLDRLPRLLRGYGRSLQHMDAAVVVVVDLDRGDCGTLLSDLQAVAAACDPAPAVLFRIAIEELEAWFLGDRAALLAAYPRAKMSALARYRQDSICGTWELLADAIHDGGARALKDAGWPAPGDAKCRWAEAIGPHMDVDHNASPSFVAFRRGVRRLVGGAPQSSSDKLGGA